jgi:hypothetical protein
MDLLIFIYVGNFLLSELFLLRLTEFNETLKPNRIIVRKISAEEKNE